ncbi:MAG: FAD-binding oxidoreductase [bacterium]
MVADMSWADYLYRVHSSGLVTPVIRELSLSPDTTALPYRPGQYVLLRDRDFHVPQRSYSVANAPRPDGRITLLVTRVASGRTSSWVHGQLRPDEQVTLTGPYGTFMPGPHRTGPVLLLAAGSGLAPVRALAEALLDGQPPRPVTLFFSARTTADSIDHARWLDWANTRPGFRYLRTLTRDPHAPARPRIPDILPTAVGDLTGWEVFASGPPGFVTGCAAAACALGAEPAAVHTEEFFTEPQPWSGPAPTPAEPSTRR